jgi:hypothetical protein
MFLYQPLKMENISNVDWKSLLEDPEFKRLTVEQAMRLLGEREKARIENERERLVGELQTHLTEKTSAMRSSRRE